MLIKTDCNIGYDDHALGVARRVARCCFCAAPTPP